MTQHVIDEARALWLDSLRANYAAKSTCRKYRHVTSLLASHFGGKPLAKITPADLQAFRATRNVKASTAHGEIQILKTFFAFCEEQGWVATNPARKLKSPKVKKTEKTPYTQEEIISILAAADRVSASAYARLRAKAALLLMRHHGLRVSDAIGLRRDAITQVAGQWRLRLRTQKTGAQIDHLVPEVVRNSLNLLPTPLGAENLDYFFWSGRGSVGSTLANMQNLLRKVYRLSGVKGAHNHRLRHNFASELLAKGADIPRLAYLMGISPVIALKTYAHLTPEFQKGADAVFLKIGEAPAMREAEASGGGVS